MKHSYAVITGASSGIGAEFARQLAGEGYPLVLVARREERLRELKEEILQDYGSDRRIRILPCDLSREEECIRLLNTLNDIRIGVFINNAGFGKCGEFLTIDTQQELSMIDVNVRAVHLLTKMMLQYYEKRQGGYLLNVASSAGLIPGGPYLATYYATKNYVTALTRGVAEELRRSGSPIYLGTLCPGPVDTEFNSVADVEFALPGISTKECVRAAIRGMKQRKVVIIPSLSMKAAIILGRHLPQKLYIRLTGDQQRKKLGLS